MTFDEKLYFKITLLKILLVSMLFLTACGDSTELKNTEFVSAIAVDYTDQVEVTLELLHSDQALKSQYASSYYYLKGSGENLTMALADLQAKGAKALSFSHTGLAIISADACENVDLWLDYFQNSYKLRPTIYLAIAENNASDILEKSDNAKKIANSHLILNTLSLSASQDQGFAGATMQDFVNLKATDGAEPVLPIISQNTNQNNEKSAGVFINKFAIFDNEKLADTLTETEILPWLMLAQNKNNQGITLNVGDAVVEVKNSQTHMNIKEVPAKTTDVYYLNLEINTEVEALIRENPSHITDEVLCQMLAKKLEVDLIKGVNHCQKLGLDYLALGQEISEHRPKIWQEIQNTDYLNQLHPTLIIKTKIGQSVYENQP